MMGGILGKPESSRDCIYYNINYVKYREGIEVKTFEKG